VVDPHRAEPLLWRSIALFMMISALRWVLSVHSCFSPRTRWNSIHIYGDFSRSWYTDNCCFGGNMWVSGCISSMLGSFHGESA
jgi:hypothetical protein